MLSRLQAFRSNPVSTLVRSKLVSNNNLLTSTQNVICKRWSGHHAMDITPSNYGWKHFKDMVHLYAVLAGIPMFVISAIVGIRANPELIEIPEGYEPRHWEYFKHPITRWMAKYWFHPQELDQECFLSFFEMQSESAILRTIEKKVKETMEFYADHRSQNFRPIYGEYYRSGRDESIYGALYGLSNHNKLYEAGYDPEVAAVPTEGYVPPSLTPSEQ